MALFGNNGKIHFTSEDKNAFFTVLEQFEDTKLSNRLGCCFKMLTDEDELVWVSTSSILGRVQALRGRTIIAERCHDKKKSQPESLDLGQVKSNAGVSFIKCTTNDDNFLRFGFWKKNAPSEASAFVYDEKKLIELKFVNEMVGGNSYKLDTSNLSQPSSSFELRQAIGAPVIFEICPPGRNQVVGILDGKLDDSLYPVFFDLNTFKSDENSFKSPSEEGHEDLFTDTRATEKVNKFGNGDKTDSPSYARPENFLPKQTAKQVHAQETQSDSSTAMDPEASQQSKHSKCIKDMTLQVAPQMNQLFVDLKVYLDPKRPLGDDYSSLAEAFGYNMVKIRYFETKESPTEAILDEQRTKCTISRLRSILVEIKRHDVVEVIDEYINDQGCNCEQCGSLC